MKLFNHLRRAARSGFTLIETLVVVAIIVLILTLTAPSLFSTMKATKLSASGDSVLGFLSEAQQLAVSNNVPVEVRFFKYRTALSPFNAFRSMQMFRITHAPMSVGGQVTEVIESVGNLMRLSEGVILIHDPSNLSPLFGANGFPDKKAGGNGTYSGQVAAEYNAVRFLPDGSCRGVTSTTEGQVTLTFPALPQSCITLCEDIGQAVTIDNLPRNFYCIQIDPYTSKIRTYRPGQN